MADIISLWYASDVAEAFEIEVKPLPGRSQARPTTAQLENAGVALAMLLWQRVPAATVKALQEHLAEQYRRNKWGY